MMISEGSFRLRRLVWTVALLVAFALSITEVAAESTIEEVAHEAEAATAVAVAAAEVGNVAEFTVSNLWIMLAGMLVFLMHLGFAAVESGLCRAKNCSNILFKNTLIPAIGFTTYALCGFALMYPGESWVLGKILGFSGLGLTSPEGAAIVYNGAFTYWTDFFFQGMFAATAATIVSGAVAERIKVHSFLIFSIIYVALVYPVLGSWGWGGGWLAGINFHDFAGSTFVHSVGGWGALAGIMLLGPRLGKYVNGHPMPLAGHSMPLATAGVFCLWLGWFGFNGGSVLNADPEAVSYVLVTTMLGACAGVLCAMVTAMVVLGKPDLSMTLNGCLAGLVAITAGADCVSLTSAIIIGGLGGILVVLSVLMFDRLKLDDPVGALSVHLVCGIWGTLAVGIFSFDEAYTFTSQLYGVLAIGVVAFPAAFVLFLVIRQIMGLRVSEEEELRGLDVEEHGMEAYPGFQFFLNQ